MQPYRPLAALVASAVGVAAAAAAVVIIRKQLCHTEKSIKTIVITGGCGNLATKLATHLLATRGDEVRVVLIEHPLFVRPEVIPEGAELVVLDLGSPSAIKLLRETLHGVDTVVHFSAVNPYPNASWAESAASMDHSFNVLLASQKGKVRRFVLASSNHVMGGYKDDDEEEEEEEEDDDDDEKNATWTSTDTTETTEAPPRTLVRGGGGLITPQLKVRVGTKVKAVERCGDAVAYGAAKLAAERLCASLAAAAAWSPSSTSFVALRIGWCQPGANLPSTLSAEGAPPIFLNPLATDNSKEERPFSEPSQAATVAEAAGGASLSSSSEAAAPRAPEAPEAPAAEDAPCRTDDEAWFKGMWLSNRDFLAYMDAAIRLPAGTIRERARRSSSSGGGDGGDGCGGSCNFVVVNAMSKNTGMKWCLADTERILGVKALDDSLVSPP